MGSTCPCSGAPNITAEKVSRDVAFAEDIPDEDHRRVMPGAASSTKSPERRMSEEIAKKLDDVVASDIILEGPTAVAQEDNPNLDDVVSSIIIEASEGPTETGEDNGGKEPTLGEDHDGKELAMVKRPSHVEFRPEEAEVREYTVTRDPTGKHAPKPKPDDSILGTHGGLKTFLSGFVWKLNADVAYKNSNDMASIESWRQRVIAVKRCSHTGKVVLNYMSEKENGAEALFGVLVSGRSGKPAKVTKLPVVSLTAMSTELHRHVATDMYEYDKAINKKYARHKHIEKYELEIPKMLHPILVSWKDEQRKTVEHVFALESKDDQRTWMVSLKAAMGS